MRAIVEGLVILRGAHGSEVDQRPAHHEAAPMHGFAYLRATSVADAARLLGEHAEARVLAGGQSLLAAMKLGLNTPSHLIDLQDIPGLKEIRSDGDVLHIGAMVTHARIARSPDVQAFCPMLAALARGIADEQVRAVGTIGGSLANNDPAACWPAGVLAAGGHAGDRPAFHCRR